jgi:hypothetical protein
LIPAHERAGVGAALRPNPSLAVRIGAAKRKRVQEIMINVQENLAGNPFP